jgi:hypothetical protein
MRASRYWASALGEALDLAHQHPRQLAPLPEPRPDGTHQLWDGLLRGQLADRGDQLGELRQQAEALDQLLEQALLGGEVVVEAGLRDPDRGGHRVHRGLGEAIAREHAERRLQDLLPAGLGVLLALVGSHPRHARFDN